MVKTLLSFFRGPAHREALCQRGRLRALRVRRLVLNAELVRPAADARTERARVDAWREQVDTRDCDRWKL
jgi:hypothetical protein